MNQPAQYPQGAAAPGYAQPKPVGKIRSPGGVFLSMICTFGLYGMYYHYCTFDELHRWRGQGSGAA